MGDIFGEAVRDILKGELLFGRAAWRDILERRKTLERRTEGGRASKIFPRVSFPLCFCFFLFSLHILLWRCIVVDLGPFMFCSSWLAVPLLFLLVFEN